MKKNLITIFLLVGAVTLNLSMLSKTRCVDSLNDRQVNVAAIEAAQHASVVTHYKGHEVKAGSGSKSQHGSGVKCVCGVEGPVHLDFNFIVAAVEMPPKNHALHAIPTAVSVFTNVASVPQDRPPKLFA